MARLFRKMVGKTCNQDDCTLQGQSADLKAGFCEACGKPLFELTAPDRVQQLLAVLVVLGALAGVGYGTLTHVRAQPVRQAASVPVGAAPKAAAVPHPSPAEAQRQMEARLREMYRHGEPGAAEKADLAKLLAGDPALAQDYAELERSRLPHLIEASRKIRTGQELVAQRLYEHAREDFLQATVEDPQNAGAWAALGGVDMLTRREEEARQAYEKALTIDPDSWIAHYNFGFYFARKGETEAALLHLDRAVSLLGRSGNVDRTTVMNDLRNNPVLAPLRRDPRFARLLG